MSAHFSFPTLLLSLLCWTSLPQLAAQELYYEVYRGDAVVGFMNIKHTQQGERSTYSSTTEMSITFLITVNLKFTYESHFFQGNLQSSLTRNYRGGKLRNSSRGYRLGKDYITYQDDEKKVLSKQDIDQSIQTLNFKEPIGRDYIFSERWGEMLRLERVGSHKYALHIPDGSINYFSYQNGRCTGMQVNHSLATLDFRLKQVDGKVVTK